MATEMGGWSTSDYTNLIASVEFAIAIFGLFVGGWAVDRVGPKHSLIVVMAFYAAGCVAMILLRPSWGADWQLIGMVWYFNICSILYAIAMIPLAMRLCRPRSPKTSTSRSEAPLTTLG